jgi:hypothetical protein
MDIDENKIDEKFLPILKKLWKAGVITTNCCQGHVWEDAHCVAYLSFCEHKGLLDYLLEKGYTVEYKKKLIYTKGCVETYNDNYVVYSEGKIDSLYKTIYSYEDENLLYWSLMKKLEDEELLSVLNNFC